ncbi:TPA: hypothetical protein SMP82_000130 [Proteus mirabilis]|nr:hypothetical protein [Proteus mirabilis]
MAPVLSEPAPGVAKIYAHREAKSGGKDIAFKQSPDVMAPELRVTVDSHTLAGFQ